ncbi:MAG: hypothetical protein IKD54_08325 [Clostridia bacterium]|nr:hypothetical protein [Clostridia bacterium]
MNRKKRSKRSTGELYEGFLMMPPIKKERSENEETIEVEGYEILREYCQAFRLKAITIEHIRGGRAEMAKALGM